MSGGTGGQAIDPSSNDVGGGTGGSQLNGTAATAGGTGGGGGGGGAGGGGLGGAGGVDAGVVGGNGGEGGANGTGTAATLAAGTGSTGGTGVQGGTGTGGGGGGGGGEGGYGAILIAGQNFTNAAAVLGGTGGIGGGISYGAPMSSHGGAGGDGGVGLVFAAGAATVVDNTGSITGGSGGAGGAGYGQTGATGLGAAGVVGAGLSITMEVGSSISGGIGRAGQADAIDFLSGANTLTLAGGTLAGTILDGATDPATSLTFDQSTAQTLSNLITGMGSVIDAGSGTLTLTDIANTYAGGTTLSGGTLDVTAPDNGSLVTLLGTGPIAFDGGTLGMGGAHLANSATIDARGGGIVLTDFAQLDGDIGTAPGANAGAFTISAATALNNTELVLTGNDTFAGGLAIENTSVSVGDGGATGTLTGNVIGSTSGSGYGALIFDHSAGTTTTFAGNLSGDIGLSQEDGITVLSGTNTYTRTTTFGTGTLQAGSAGAFSAASQMSADSSDAEATATIDLAGFNETIGGLIASSTNDDPSQFDIVTNSRSTAATLTIAAGGPSTAYATQQDQIYGGGISGYGRYFDGVIEDGDPNLGGGTLAVDVAGNLNLSRHSTYTGGTTVDAGGTLTFLTESADHSTQNTDFGAVQGAITDDGTIALVAVTAYGVTGPLVVGNAISGSGGLTVTVDPENAKFDGIVLLTGADTYTGATLVDHGTLQGGAADAFSADSAVTINGNTFGHGATLDLGGDAQAIGALSGDSGGIVTDSGAAATLTLGGGDESGTFLGTIRDGAGAVALDKVGAGTETLSGFDSYTGGTTITAGTLEFTSDAALPPGTIAFAGNQATLKLDATPANGATFADPLSGFLPGDALDLQGLTFAPGATATLSGNTLVVTSGATTEDFTLADTAAITFTVTQDGADGTLVTGVAVPVSGPAIAGAVADQPVSDTTTIDPFAQVTVTDTGTGQTDTVTITQSDTANGVLTDPNAATDECSVSGNVMTLSGTAAQVTADLDALVFTPTAHQVAPGSTVTTGFTLGVTDTAGATASDTTTSIVATATETPPAIGGTQSGQAITDQQTLNPFAAATITDPDFGASETTTITLSNGGAGGTLAGAGLTQTGTGVYTLAAASPADEQAELRALVFTPATGHVATGNVMTTQATLGVSDGTDAATDGATTIAVTQAATGTSMGDVHMVTLDGLHYDFQADGDFTLERSTVAGNPFDIQIRTAPWAENNQTSLTMEAAAQIGQNVVAFTPGVVTINGIADTALDADHPVQQLDGGTLTALGNGDYQLDWAGGEGLTVSNEGFFLNLHTTVAPSDGPGSVEGLLGSLTGQASDLALPDGTVLAQSVPDATLLGQFADAWRLGAGSMLDGGGPAITPVSLGLPVMPSFVTPVATDDAQTGSLGQAAASGHPAEENLSNLPGAAVGADFAPTGTIDLTGAALAAADFRFAPAGPSGIATFGNGSGMLSATTYGHLPSAVPQFAPDSHGAALVRVA